MSTSKFLALKAAISEALELPSEITLNLPKIIIFCTVYPRSYEWSKLKGS